MVASMQCNKALSQATSRHAFPLQSLQYVSSGPAWLPADMRRSVHMHCLSACLHEASLPAAQGSFCVCRTRRRVPASSACSS